MRLIDADALKKDDELTEWLTRDTIRTGKMLKAFSELFVKKIDDAPTVNAVSEEVYTREYNLRKDAEFKVYKLEKALEQEQKPKTIQEMQAESEKYQKAFEDGYEKGYAQARFDYEQEPCEDCISRQAVLNQIFYSTDNSGDVVLGSVLRRRIENLPSVRPQEPYFWEKCPYYEPDIMFDEKDEYDMGKCTYKQEPCGDDISRHDVECIVEELENICHNAPQEVLELLAKLKNAPFATPYPKTGHWIGIDEEPHEDYECDNCGYVVSTFTANIEPHTEYKYCPNCGAKMESEEKHDTDK